MTRASTKPILVALVSQGGMGKTTLAQQAAYELFHEDKKFRSVLWVDVKRNPNPDILLLNWAKLGDPNFTTNGQLIQNSIPTIKASLETLITKECIHCSSNYILVVLDDTWEDGVQAIKLLKKAMPQHTRVLITTRHKRASIQLNALTIELDYLKPPQAIELLREYLPTELDLSESKLDELAKVLGGHALALTLAARRLLEDPHRVAGLSRHIKEYQKGLAEGTLFDQLEIDPDDKEGNLELSLSYSYDALTSEEQARFRALGVLIYDEPFDLNLLATLWNVNASSDIAEPQIDTLEIVRKWADRLANLSLLEGVREDELGDGWYRQHPLLHAYARALLKKDQSEYDKILNNYHNIVIKLAYQFGITPIQDWQQLDAYLPHIFATGDYLVQNYKQWSNSEKDHHKLEQAQEFAFNVYYLLYKKPEIDHVNWLEMGLFTAKQLENKERGSLFLHELGLYHRRRGNLDKALDYYNEVVRLDMMIGDKDSIATTLNNIGQIYYRKGALDDALEYYQKALPLAKSVNNQEREADILDNIGLIHWKSGKLQRALTYFEDALVLKRKLNDLEGKATSFTNIGTIFWESRNPEKALEYYKEALSLHELMQNKSGQCTVLNNFGTLYLEQEDFLLALKYYSKALTLAREIKDGWKEAASLNGLGMVYKGFSKWGKALDYFQQALTFTKTLHDRGGEATIFSNIGGLYADLGEKKKAFKFFQEALVIFQELGYQQKEVSIKINIGMLFTN